MTTSLPIKKILKFLSMLSVYRNKFFYDFEPKATHKKKEAMKKQTYQKPELRVVKIQQTRMLCLSGVTDVNSGDTGITYGGGKSSVARSRGDSWFDDEE